MSIRLRLAVAFAIVFAAAFSLGSWLLVSQLKTVMLRSTDAGLATQLARVGRSVGAEPAGSRPSLSALPPGDYVAQLIDQTGRVRASSEEAGAVPLLTGAQLRTARRAALTMTTTVDGDSERLAAGPLAGRPGWVAVVGISLESLDATVTAVVTRLAVGGAILVVVSGLGSFALARAALAPVERLRRRAAVLSAGDPSSRLPVPATNDEVAALAGTMNDLLGRLHEALANQRAFVADASHELRTPFAVLSAELELAAKPGRTREELAAAVTSASEEAARLSQLTNDLLLLATSDEDRLAARTSPTDLADLLAKAATLAGQRGSAAGVTCRAEVPGPLIVSVDPGLIRRAVDNLLDNALRFAPPGSQIVVAGGTQGQDAVITVTDAGPGFPAEYLPRAFERFSRPDSGRARADGGVGLGLSIVKAIAQAHGGRVTANNLDSDGAIVRIDLPGAAGETG
ncbi:MAG TPA: ATP-binding protein [Streptosporangiaceae bacterium]|nr:ATP-binding protein [Streptosporangiaceae bacterium]